MTTNPTLRRTSQKLFASIFNEAKNTTGLGAGNNDDSIDLSQGTTNQFVKTVRISTNGTVGFVQIQFFDGLVAANKPITGALFLISQPSPGFNLFAHLTTGTLGYRITNTSAGDAFVNVEYSF